MRASLRTVWAVRAVRAEWRTSSFTSFTSFTRTSSGRLLSTLYYFALEVSHALGLNRAEQLPYFGSSLVVFTEVINVDLIRSLMIWFINRQGGRQPETKDNPQIAAEDSYFGQIHFTIKTNTFCNLDKYIKQFGQIYKAISTNIFVNLDKCILQCWQIDQNCCTGFIF